MCVSINRYHTIGEQFYTEYLAVYYAEKEKFRFSFYSCRQDQTTFTILIKIIFTEWLMTIKVCFLCFNVILYIAVLHYCDNLIGC